MEDGKKSINKLNRIIIECLTWGKFLCIVAILDDVVEPNTGRVHDALKMIVLWNKQK